MERHNIIYANVIQPYAFFLMVTFMFCRIILFAVLPAENVIQTLNLWNTKIDSQNFLIRVFGALLTPSSSVEIIQHTGTPKVP